MTRMSDQEDTDGRIISRMDSFLSEPGAGILAGNRRMGTDALMDTLAERLERRAKVIRIKSTEDMIERVRQETCDDVHVVIYCRIGDDELNAVMREFPKAHVYRAQELCHQLPACVRESRVLR